MKYVHGAPTHIFLVVCQDTAKEWTFHTLRAARKFVDCDPNSPKLYAIQKFVQEVNGR